MIPQLNLTAWSAHAPWPELRQVESGLADQINMHQATISNLESPEGVATLKTLFAVLSALDLELVLRPRTKSSHERIADVF